MRLYPDCGRLKLPCAHGVSHFLKPTPSIGPTFTKEIVLYKTKLFSIINLISCKKWKGALLMVDFPVAPLFF